MKLRGIMFGSEQPQVLGEFYAKVLGKPAWQDGDWWGFEAGEAGLMVGPHSEVKGANQSPARIMVNFEVDDIHGQFDRIKNEGAHVVAEPYQPNENDENVWLATLADPDGNYFQLSTPWGDPPEA